jgi:hypothetical protein
VFQQLLPLIPQEPGSLTLVVATAGTLAGGAMWLAGARFSRPVLTLTAVALGTLIGKKLPLWCGWSVDEMGPAVGGAVILGVSAFALHRLWVGLWLGTVLSCWAALATWLIMNHDAYWAWPVFGLSTLPHYLLLVWQQLPADVTMYLPIACGTAMLAGSTAGILWPRLGLVLMWSSAGVTLLIGTAMTAAEKFSPDIFARLPKQTWPQIATLAILIAAGAFWQWRMVRPETADPVPKKQVDPSDD